MSELTDLGVCEIRDGVRDGRFSARSPRVASVHILKRAACR